MSALWLLALLAGAGVFLAFAGLALPPSIRLARPAGGGFLDRLEERLRAAELPVSAREFLLVCGIVALLSALAALLIGAPALALAGVVLGPALVWARYEAQRDRFRQDYEASLAECVQLLREGFAATGSLRDALDHAVRNGPDPAAADFREVWHAYVVGTDLEEAFGEVLRRRRNPFLRMVAEALTLKATEGGNVGEVLLGLETMIREQAALRREIAAKQAQARLEATIVSLAPLGFFVALKVVPWMREYEGGFYGTLLGQILLAVALIFSTAAYFLSRRLAVRGLSLEVKEA